jgi:intraflagellar transport protein 57
MNEDLIEQLKALDYESKFCEKTGNTQIARSHFAYESNNRDGQFKLFLQLASWLLELTSTDASFEIEEYDDPNTSVTKMMLALKGIGFAMEVSAMKLKQGYGEAVLNVLGYLCDKAMKGEGSRPAVAARHRVSCRCC